MNREPLLAWAPTPKAAPFNMGYKVPHFGTDHDVVNSADDIAWAERQLGHKWTPKDDPPPPDRDYFVPHFGADAEVKDVDQAIAAGEKMHNHHWTITEEKKDPPPDRDYFVPHFGEDKDITATQNSLALAEKQYGKWVFPDPSASDSAPPSVPNFGVDHDIADSLRHLSEQEARHGQWNLAKDDYYQVQLDAEVDREPLLTWAPTAPQTHPMNYFVPNFGEDHDITNSKAHEAEASAKLDHAWVPTKDKDGDWELPSPQIEFKLAQTLRR